MQGRWERGRLGYCYFGGGDVQPDGVDPSVRDTCLGAVVKHLGWFSALGLNPTLLEQKSPGPSA